MKAGRAACRGRPGAASASAQREVTIAYNTADFFIERYAKDYLALVDPQIASWKPELKSALASHRREDPPYLARFFDAAHESATEATRSERKRRSARSTTARGTKMPRIADIIRIGF